MAGPKARFRVAQGSSEGTVCLQNVGNGLYLHFDEASQTFYGDSDLAEGTFSLRVGDSLNTEPEKDVEPTGSTCQLSS